MTIAFLCDYYAPFEIGGAERSSARLAAELAARGHRVVVVTPNYGTEPRGREGSIEIVRLRFPERLEPGEVPRRFWTSNPLLHAMYCVQLARLLRRLSADVLHIQNSTYVASGVLAARLAAVPSVVTVRDLAYLSPEPGAGRLASLKWRVDAAWARAERSIKRASLRRATAVTFVSAALRDECARRDLDRMAAGSRVLYNIAPDAVSAVEHARDVSTVLYVGKLSTGKGLPVLYRAAALVLEQVPAARFVLAGLPGIGFEPPPPALAEHFDLPGRVDEHVVATLMRRASLVVAPAVWPEPFSRVLLEAMSAGTAIVATDVGGNAEALGADVAAILVPPGSHEALAGAMVALLRDPERARLLGNAARERVRTMFSAQAVVPQVLELYRECL